MRSNNLVKNEIPYASTLKKTLSGYGYTVEDTSKIPRFLREIEVCGGNAKVFLERADEAKDLKWEIFDLCMHACMHAHLRYFFYACNTFILDFYRRASMRSIALAICSDMHGTSLRYSSIQ